MRILNATDTIPISASYFADSNLSFNDNGQLIETYYDGYNLYSSNILNSLKDISFNKYSFFGLTSGYDITDIISDTEYSVDTLGPLLIGYSTNLINVNSTYELEASPINEDAVMYAFEHVETIFGDKYYKIDYRDFAFTLNSSNELELSLYTSSDNQLFRFIPKALNTFTLESKNGQIALFNGFPRFFITKNGTTRINVNSINTDFDGYSSPNSWVRYNNFYAPEYSKSISILDIDTDNIITNNKTNIILTAPIGNISIKNKVGNLYVDLIPTKNFKTISYEQSIIPLSGLSGKDLIDFREYNRIYTGGNRTEGYSNIHLGFESDYSSVIELKGDEYTYFHIPKNISNISIQDAGFKYAGAFAGQIPEFSDRIYKKLSNYDDTLWWGGGSHNAIQDGNWLCAWLSAGSDDTSVWVERYYNPGKIDAESALSEETSATVSDINFISNPNPVQDIYSTMTIEGGAYYKYFHVGSKTLSTMLEKLKGINDSVTILKFIDFTTDNIVNDESDNNNDGTISYFEKSSQVSLDIGFGTQNDSAVLLNNGSDIRVSSSDSLDISGNLGITSWVYSANWPSGRSAPILSHYYRSGYKFEYINHGLYYSYMFPNITSGNEEFVIIPSDSTSNSNLIVLDQIGGTPTSMAIDSDNYIWAITYDSGSSESRLFKFSSAGTVLESLTLEGLNIRQIIIANENTGFLKNVNGDVYKLDLYSCDVSLSASVPSGNYIYTPILDNIELAAYSLQNEEADSLDLFLDGTVCKTLNGSLYLGGIEEAKFSGYDYKHVCCDDNNYYYTTIQDLSGNIKLFRINRDDDTNVTSFGELGLPNAINASFLTKEVVKDELRTVIYWIRETDIAKYYINENNEMLFLTNIDLNSSLGGYVDGDYSGYKFNKKLHYAYQDESSYIKVSIILNNSPKKNVLTYSTSDISDNWHFIGFSKNDIDNELVLYIDGQRVSTKFIDSNSYILNFIGSALSIGGEVDGSESLFDKLGVYNRTLNGGISETEIYSQYLDDTDIIGLYYSKFNSGDYIRWVLNAGTKNYIEDIQYLFKYKKPGIKSQYFNIVIKNLDIDDTAKSLYDEYIRQNIGRMLPSNMKLVNIIWR